jgi:glyoxalase family protein
MPASTSGIRHVTGIVGDAQTAVDFYAGTLGLRFVKQTVNFEDVLQYHLYFGDTEGNPGTVFTAFADPYGDDGRVGKPQVETAIFAVPEDSLDFWEGRFADTDVPVAGIDDRFGERVLRVRDPAGTRVELVATADGTASIDPWTDGPVPDHAAIRGIAGVSVLSVNPFATAATLETLGFEYDRESDERVRYRVGDDHATAVDIVHRETEFGREGPGTLHHVAVRAGIEDDLHEWREYFDENGYDVSRVKDRHFFHSLYVREPGGILVELATETGGLVSDHPTPGATLELPAFFEDDRDMIESQLPALTVPDDRSAGGAAQSATRDDES